MYFQGFLALSLVFNTISGQDSQIPLFTHDSDSECHNACTALADFLGEQVYYNPESQLEGFRDGYHTTFQRDVVPACIISPTSAEDVSSALKIIKQYQCIFAVKSGGHAMFLGASNAPSGITIDLKKLNAIEPDEKGLQTRVGTGNRWSDVYKVLEPLGRTVVGSRNSKVGVGGFILGGGISFISRKYGWALDSVRNFEVVLANGSIADINQSSAPDLYYALRGGGKNLGIVTNFDLETYSQGKVWGGHKFWLIDNADVSSRTASLGIPSTSFSWTPRYFLGMARNRLLQAACKLGYCVTTEKVLQIFENLVLAEQGDPSAQLYITFAYVAQLNIYISGGALVYTKPDPNPEAFRNFTELKSIYNTLKIANFTEIYDEVTALNKIGYRQEWASITLKVSANLLSKAVDIFLEEIQPVLGVKDIVPNLLMQPINKEEIQLFSKNGGNCLGIEEGDGPLILFSTHFRWSRSEDQLIVSTAGSNIINRVAALAKEMGLYHRYIYQNYANISQDVFGSYGEENHARLKKIYKKYDPEGIFTKLQPGYFNI